MSQTIGIEKNILTLNQLQEKFNLRQSNDERFFIEWFEGLDEINDSEKQSLDRIKEKYFYQRADGPLTEDSIKMIVLSPLLDLAEYYDPPFRFRTEIPVKIAIEERDEIYQGRIDALVIQQQFWLLVIESKHTTFNIEIAIPQILTYMMANPHPARSLFGMITNGNNFIFIKLIQGIQPQYALSDEFSLYRRRNELHDVLRILKQIGKLLIT